MYTPWLNSHPHDARARRLLLAGAVMGILLAAVGILRSGRPAASAKVASLPGGSVAVVNGYPIAEDLYARVLGGLATERKAQNLSLADRQRILDRMIDEELLLQRGLELGLAHSDLIIRRRIVAALTANITAEAEDIIPDKAELQRFYQEHTDFFARSGRLSCEQIFFSASSVVEDALVRQQADKAAQRLRAGEPFDLVRRELGDEPVMRLPTGPLPAEKIQEYLGPTVVRALLTLAPGEVSDPVRSGVGYHVLVLHARQPAVVPPFASIREQVLVQYRRAAAERAMADYIAELRARARIRVKAEPLN